MINSESNESDPVVVFTENKMLHEKHHYSALLSLLQ
jgi:hypothetical protein